jgi:hypothetical protein
MYAQLRIIPYHQFIKKAPRVDIYPHCLSNCLENKFCIDTIVISIDSTTTIYATQITIDLVSTLLPEGLLVPLDQLLYY